MTTPTPTTDDLLKEQVRLLRKADRRSGCLWNLVMFVLFSLPYLVWLTLKRLAKWAWAVLRFAWRVVRAVARWTWHAIRGAGRWVASLFQRKGASA